MNVLLLGSGGRECAMAWKLSQSPILKKLYIAPGNAGTTEYGENLTLNPLDFDSVGQKCLELAISLIIVGPEDPLVKGLVDYLKGQDSYKHIHICGPAAEGAQLEGSKDFAKRFMQRHNIPTAAYESFDGQQLEQALAYLTTLHAPYVIKADGLAAGKGVLILNNLEEAQQAVKDILIGGTFGDAGNRVVIEEFLTGIEFSVFAAFDGENYLMLPEAKDYKRIGEGDTGPNTGGMGTLSPVPFYDEELKNKVLKQIVEPTFKGLKEEKIDYKGIVFFGLIHVERNPFVIEYNCRLGDPETESILPRLNGDLLEICLAIATGTLSEIKNVTFSEKHSATVIMVSEGYPGAYTKGKKIEITKPDSADKRIFHAGTSMQGKDIVSSGGRVIAVNAEGTSLAEAIDNAYDLVNKVKFEGSNYRRDIGYEFLS